MNRTNDYAKLASQNRRNGLAFGILMALAFVLTAWGTDAAGLARHAGFMAWLKLAVGGLASLVLGAGVGWLVGAIDHGAVGLIAWGLVGITLGLLGGHLPYEGYTLVGGWLDPRFQGLDPFPFVESSQSRLTASTALVTGLFCLAGILQPVLLEQARGAASRFSRWLAFATAAPAFLLAGVIVDGLVNKPLRSPQTTLHSLISLVVRGEELTPQERLDLHVGALGPVLGMVSTPRQLMVSSYDAYDLASVGVTVEFEDGWAHCLIISNQATYCQPGDPLFTDGFACLLGAQDLRDEDCRVDASESAFDWLSSARDALGSGPALTIPGRLGAVTLLAGTGQDDQAFRCIFRGFLPATLETCTYGAAPLAGQPFFAGPAIDPHDQMLQIRPGCEQAVQGLVDPFSMPECFIENPTELAPTATPVPPGE